MTTLYAHVGIPKSGTTSIQENLRGDTRINYIDTFYFHKEDYWNSKDFRLCDDRVNIISNETFAVRGEGSGKVPLRNILQRLINEVSDTRILLTIRNQKTSLPSMFRYRILMGNSFSSFEDWLTRDEGMDYYAANQYGTLIKSMLQFIPLQQIKVLCFEDLANDPVVFYKELYEFLQLPFEQERIDCRRHANKTMPTEQVYARNIANKCIGNRYRATRRINGLAIRVLKLAIKSKIPDNFFSLESVHHYPRVMAELQSNNQALLEIFPHLRSKLEKYEYPL